MKPYQRTALYLIFTSFMCSLISTLIPDGYHWDIESWFEFMSFATAFVAGVVCLGGIITSNS